MPVVEFRKDIQMKQNIAGFVLNVSKILKTCCSASSTAHCHRQAKKAGEIHADDKVKRFDEWTQTMDETKIYLEKYKEATQCGD